jgi:hypothetical protein
MRRLLSCVLLAQCMAVAGSASAGEPSVGEVDGSPLEAGAPVDAPVGAVKNLILFGGARVALLPGSSATVSPPQWYPPEKGAKSIRGARIRLRSGEAIVGLPTDGAKPSALAVSASGGQTMLLWRGVTRVRVDDGDMVVAVDDGAAYVGSQDRWLRMSAGSAALVAKKTAPQVHKGRLAAPATAACADGGGIGVAYGTDKAPVRLCWGEVTGALGYRIEFATDEGMTHLVDAVDVASPSTLAAEPRLAPGRYSARVLAIGPAGVASAPAAPRPLVVVRAALPRGAFVAPDGAIVMANNGAVAIEAPGLAAASAGGNDAAGALANAVGVTPVTPAARAYGLNGYRARVVRLHDPSGAEARLVIVLRELRAQVEMTPTKARWPDDPIDVSVVLEDASKRVDVGAEPITLEVAIDGKLVPVTWARTGGAFRGRIAPIDGPGPFLVRVSVRDRTGAEIGAHIVDIDGRRPMKSLEQILKERRGQSRSRSNGD